MSYTWGQLKGFAAGNIHCIEVGQENILVMTHAHLAGIKDMINGLFSTYLYCLVNTCKYPLYNLKAEVDLLVTTARQSMDRDPEGVYTILKMWPSLAIGGILRDTEYRNEFLETLKTGAGKLARDPLFALFTRPLRDKVEDPLLRLEMSGLCKIFGHPIVYVPESAKAWAAKGTHVKPGLEEMGDKLSNMFKLEFCRNYHRDMKTWPRLSFSEEASDRVKEMYARQEWEETSTFPLTVEDFEGVSFEKTFEFDMFVDATELLSDKSIIQDLSVIDSLCNNTFHHY